ncbi:hypothetical protein HDV01_006234 [Terramyces sp. JEL0728]|nr:hypothetical protein HDV01_006234 [Terramyces sp. JEL0728]
MLSKCTEPNLRPYYESPAWTAGLALTILLTITSTVLSVRLMYQHFTHYSNSVLQRPITRILLMVPIYSVCSLTSYISIKNAVYIDVIRDAYEGFVVYNFFSLFLEYLGPNQQSRLLILSQKVPHTMPPPACCFMYDPRNVHFIGYCKLGVFQFVVVRLCMTVTAMVMELLGVFCHGSMSLSHGNFYTTVINGLSMGLAMFTLIAFYLPTKNDISHSSPVSQFLSVKFVIFFQFWLGLFVNILVNSGLIYETEYWTIPQFSILFQSFVVAIEMVIASLWHLRAFSIQKFVDGTYSPLADAFWDSFIWLDLIHDFKTTVRYFTVYRHVRVGDTQGEYNESSPLVLDRT